MEVKDSMNVNGKGLFATKAYAKNELVYVLSGEIFDHPTRESIHIGNNKHIYDLHGMYINLFRSYYLYRRIECCGETRPQKRGRIDV